VTGACQMQSLGLQPSVRGLQSFPTFADIATGWEPYEWCMKLMIADRSERVIAAVETLPLVMALPVLGSWQLLRP
jgi:hypothetical protein